MVLQMAAPLINMYVYDQGEANVIFIICSTCFKGHAVICTLALRENAS